MYVISVIDLTKSYKIGGREQYVLNKLTFNVPSGEMVGFVAESGNGKSTLMHILAGLETPSSGKVIIDETEIDSLMFDELAEFRRKNIGVLFQFYNLIPSLTVEQNIKFPVMLDGTKIDTKVYSEIINTLGLTNIQNKYPQVLNQYESQVVALARAMMINPKVILCDEVTGKLNTEQTDKFLELLNSVHIKYGLTIVIFSSSKKSFIYCDNVYRLVDGKIIGGENNES